MATVYDERTMFADAWPLWLSVAAFGLASAAQTYSLRVAADARSDWRWASAVRAKDGGGGGGSSSSDLLESTRSYLSRRQRTRAYIYIFLLLGCPLTRLVSRCKFLEGRRRRSK